MAPQLVFSQRLPFIAGAAACPAGQRRAGRRGFTLVELAVVGAVSVVVAMLLLPLLAPRRPGCGSPTLRDSSQVRGILQGMVLWGGSNKDRFPLPSAVDLEDATVPEAGAAKDTTANILSLMIFNGYFPVELAVSPQEVGNIQRMQDYETASPVAAVDPSRALWDPAFSADFTATSPGNTSYAHLAPVGARAKHWALSSADSTRAILGNRGPQIASVAAGPDGPVATLAGSKSNTLLIHGPRTRWHGNIGYQDNHVDLETEMAPEDVLYSLRAGGLARDTLFYDEPDDAAGDNAYLLVTIPASGVAGGQAIWD